MADNLLIEDKSDNPQPLTESVHNRGFKGKIKGSS